MVLQRATVLTMLLVVVVLQSARKTLKRTLLHSAARELKMLTAPGRPVQCMHPLRIRRRGVVPPPPATLEVLKMLRGGQR